MCQKTYKLGTPPGGRHKHQKGRGMKRLAFCAMVMALGSPFIFAAEAVDSEPGFNEPTFKGLEFRSLGPAFMAGRIADIAIDPRNQSTWYVAVGSGGVWKTTQPGHNLDADLRRPGVLLDRQRDHRPQ